MSAVQYPIPLILNHVDQQLLVPALFVRNAAGFQGDMIIKNQIMKTSTHFLICTRLIVPDDRMNPQSTLKFLKLFFFKQTVEANFYGNPFIEGNVSFFK